MDLCGFIVIFMNLAGFVWDFMDFGGLGGGPGVGGLTSCGDAVAACAAEMMPLKKPLLDPKHRFHAIFI